MFLDFNCICHGDLYLSTRIRIRLLSDPVPSPVAERTRPGYQYQEQNLKFGNFFYNKSNRKVEWTTGGATIQARP